jgi:hypothetical protein
MKKAIKIFAVIFILLIGVVIALPIIFKDKIFERAKVESKKYLYADVDFKKLDLSIFKSFPDFTLTLGEFSVVGIDNFEGDTLAYIEKFEFTIDIMSVIKGDEIQLKSFLIENSLFQAIVLEDGKANWDIMKPSEEIEKIEKEETAATKFKASLKGYAIKNTKIVYDDRKSKMKAEIINLNHSGAGDFTQDIFELQTTTSIDELTYTDAGMKYLNKAKINFLMDLDVDMPAFKFTFKNNEFSINELALGFDGFIAMPGDDIDMDLTYFAKKTEFKNILSLVPAVYMTDFSSLKTSGKLALTGFAKGIYNETSLPAFGLKLLVENGQFSYPDLPSDVKNVNIDLSIENKDGITDNTIIDLKKFYMEIAENPIEAALRITNPESDPKLKGMLKGKLVLSNIKDLIPMEEGESVEGTIVADILMDGKYSSIEKEKYEEFLFSGELVATDILYKTASLPYETNVKSMYLNFNPKTVELTQFIAQLGKSDMQMSGSLSNMIAYAMKDEVLKGDFVFNSNFLDIYELGGMEETSETATTEEAAPAPLDPNAVAVEVPNTLNVSLKSNIKKIKYDDIEITNLNGLITIENSQMSFQNINLEMLEGKMGMNGYYNTVNIKDPIFDFNMNIVDFDMQKTATTFNTVEKMAPIIKSAFGKYSVGFKVRGKFDNHMSPIYETLAGSGSLSTKEVKIKGFNVTDKIADLLKMPQYKELTLNNVNLDFVFSDGKVDVAPFDFKVKDSKVTVYGSNYFDQRIDYTWSFEIPSSEFGGAANQAMNSLLSQVASKGLNINPVDKIKIDMLITGTATDPKIKMGTPSLAGGKGSVKDDLKDRAKEELEKKKQELENKAREEADRLKKEAEDRAKQEVDKAKQKAQEEADKAKQKAQEEADRLKKEAEEKARQEAEKLKEEGKDKLRGLIKK